MLRHQGSARALAQPPQVWTMVLRHMVRATSCHCCIRAFSQQVVVTRADPPTPHVQRVHKIAVSRNISFSMELFLDILQQNTAIRQPNSLIDSRCPGYLQVAELRAPHGNLRTPPCINNLFALPLTLENFETSG